MSSPDFVDIISCGEDIESILNVVFGAGVAVGSCVGVAVGGLPKVGSKGVGSGGSSLKTGSETQALIRSRLRVTTKLIWMILVDTLYINCDSLSGVWHEIDGWSFSSPDYIS